MTADADCGYLAFLPPLVLAGIGASAAVPVSQAAIVAAVDDADIGKAAGSNNMLQELGGAFGVAASVMVFAAVGSYATAGDFAEGFRAAMGASAGLAALAFGAALALPRRPRSANRPPASAGRSRAGQVDR